MTVVDVFIFLDSEHRNTYNYNYIIIDFDLLLSLERNLIFISFPMGFFVTSRKNCFILYLKRTFAYFLLANYLYFFVSKGYTNTFVYLSQIIYFALTLLVFIFILYIYSSFCLYNSLRYLCMSVM